MSPHAVDTTREDDGAVAQPDWEIVGLLWMAFFLNQADRQVFNVVMPLIRADLGLSDTALGLVATTFTIVYGVLVPVAGLLGDFTDRRRLVIASLIIFSVGTLLTGFASSLVMLLVFRGVATGAGEALYAPAAFSLIGESHNRTRARALAVHQTANYTGIVLGSLVAGWIGQELGWRMSFLFYGALGLLWAAVIYWRTRSRPVSTRSRPSFDAQRALVATAARVIARRPVILAQMLAFGGLIFSYVGFLTWMPTLLVERFGLSVANAGFSSVFYHLLLSYLALLLASYLTDRTVRRWSRIRLVSMSIGLILCAPFIWLIPESRTLSGTFVLLGCYGFARGVYDASIFAALFDDVEDELRSTISGLLLASGFVIGAASPLILGALKQGYGLEAGFQLLAAASAVTGAVLLLTTMITRRPAREKF